MEFLEKFHKKDIACEMIIEETEENMFPGNNEVICGEAGMKVKFHIVVAFGPK